MRKGNAERGFTLIEIMIVVAIVALLAVIVIPSFTGETRKARGGAEVSAMFAELSVKLEQYKVENNIYPAAAADPGVTCAAAPTNAGYNWATTCTAALWATELRVVAPESTMRCAYTILTGTTADTLTPPTGFLNSQGAAAAEPAMARGWWFVKAECDQDGNSTTPNSLYYMSSVDSKIQKQNEGK